MNIAIRKLAMLEQQMKEQEERSRLEGFTSCPIDQNLKYRIQNLMDKVRII